MDVPPSPLSTGSTEAAKTMCITVRNGTIASNRAVEVGRTNNRVTTRPQNSPVRYPSSVMNWCRFIPSGLSIVADSQTRISRGSTNLASKNNVPALTVETPISNLVQKFVLFLSFEIVPWPGRRSLMQKRGYQSFRIVADGLMHKVSETRISTNKLRSPTPSLRRFEACSSLPGRSTLVTHGPDIQGRSRTGAVTFEDKILSSGLASNLLYTCTYTTYVQHKNMSIRRFDRPSTYLRLRQFSHYLDRSKEN